MEIPGSTHAPVKSWIPARGQTDLIRFRSPEPYRRDFKPPSDQCKLVSYNSDTWQRVCMMMLFENARGLPKASPFSSLLYKMSMDACPTASLLELQNSQRQTLRRSVLTSVHLFVSLFTAN